MKPPSSRSIESKKILQQIEEMSAEILDAMKERACGVLVQKIGSDGQPVVYAVPPDAKAAAWLLERGLRVEQIEAEIRLSQGRAAVQERTLEVKLLEAQAHFLNQQAEVKAIEGALYPKQFVTEEDQREMLVKVITGICDTVTKMSVERWQEFSGSDGLEKFKNQFRHRAQAVLADVMGGTVPDDDMSEVEEEESDGGGEEEG
jgi:hypothetical protein